MEVYRHIDEIPAGVPGGANLMLGCFDGVHIAHRAIIAEALRRRRADCDRTGLITFSPCPALVFRTNGERCLITSTEEKIALLEETGIDWALVIDFNQEFMNISAEDFVSDILVKKLGVGVMVVGHDVGFGHKRRGDTVLLRAEAKRYGFEVHVLAPVVIDGETVSSTAARRRVAACDFDGAARILGRPYFISGPVVHDRHLGATIGTPTANVTVNEFKLLPSEGVYAARTRTADGASHPAVLSIGTRPTVDTTGELAIEVHILDFDADIYHTNIHTEPVKFLRPQEKFDSLDALKNQISLDIEQARQIL